MAPRARKRALKGAKINLPLMVSSIRDPPDLARASLVVLGVAWALSACELVLGDVPDNPPRSSSATTGNGSGGAMSTASTSSATTTGTGGCCDCDGDGYMSAACGGTDCDDTSADVHPGQMMFFGVGRPSDGQFDYDCDGKIEWKDPAVVNCSPPLGLMCDTTTHGFLGAEHPACGTKSKSGSCVKDATTLACMEQVEQPMVLVLCR